MKFIKTLTILVFASLVSLAQRRGPEPEGETIDAKVLAYGVTTNTNSGILGGFVLRSSTPVSAGKKKPVHRYLALELVNIRHPKESQRGTPLGTRYAYGKVNYLFSVRPEYGREWFFFNKIGENSIGLSGVLAAGPSLGIEKPYYIKYGAGSPGESQTVVFDPDIYSDLSKISGAAGIWNGFLNNAKVVPGFHLKSALNVDMSTFGDNITGFELGSTIEVFTRRTEILSPKITNSPSAFVSAYLTLYFGNKRLTQKKGKL
jgi:hypothetical protein